MKVLCLLFGLGAVSLPSVATASEYFEGTWARSKAECNDREGPNSRTLISLSNRINGRRVPLFDQYENHCKIVRHATNSGITILKANCFEFWENFTKDENGQNVAIALDVRNKMSLTIDGVAYLRCAR